jgi:hypothetical protein
VVLRTTYLPNDGSRTADRIFLKFGTEFTPSDATPKSYFLIVCYQAIPTWRMRKTVKWGG